MVWVTFLVTADMLECRVHAHTVLETRGRVILTEGVLYGTTTSYTQLNAVHQLNIRTLTCYIREITWRGFDGNNEARKLRPSAGLLLTYGAERAGTINSQHSWGARQWLLGSA
jgi:hypothetical protein